MNTRSISPFWRFVLGLILLCSLVLTEATPASAAFRRCYVKANAAGLNNGSSWANAYRSLQSALSTASGCTEVWVAKGTYKPTKRTNSADPRSATFQLKNGVAIYGGFAGAETVLTQRKPATNVTMLSGDIGVAGSADNTYHVVTGSNTDNTARLDGFTITGGFASSSAGYPLDRGGGLFNQSGNFTLANLTFINNEAAAEGGAMENRSASPSLTNVTFSANSAAEGGAMFNYQSSPQLLNVTFIGNRSVYDGGAIINVEGSSPSLTNVTFSDNEGNFGGGIHNYLGSNPTLTNVTFSGNSAAYGGAISNKNSSPIITNSILYANTGEEIFNDASSPVVTYSIVQGGYFGTGNLDANPRLLPLGNYGGFTKTMPLAFESAAIDSGTPSGCPAADQRGFARPQDGDGNGTRVCDMGATESRILSKTFPSLAAQDGVIQETSENSGIGGAVDAANITFAMGDDVLDRQGLSILSFSTGVLPDTAPIVSARLNIKQAGLGVGINPFTTHGNILVDVRKGPFSNNAALQPADFQALSSKPAAMTILNNPTPAGLYSGAMPSGNLIYINKLGLTQFRLRFALDDNDDMHADYLKFFSGNYAIAAYRPVLTVSYYMP